MQPKLTRRSLLVGLAASLPNAALANCPTCLIMDPNWQPATPPRVEPRVQASPAPQAEPAAPAVSDSTRSIRRGDRFIYVQNRLDSQPRRAVYFAGGNYINDETTAVNFALRDHYSGATADMQRRLLDFMFMTYQELNLSVPYFLVSGYRSPATNAMLREQSLARNGGTTGVAINSPHMHAIASDLRATGRSTSQIYQAARRVSGQLGYGGVGLYTRDNFVHIDGNARRTWGV